MLPISESTGCTWEKSDSCGPARRRRRRRPPPEAAKILRPHAISIPDSLLEVATVARALAGTCARANTAGCITVRRLVRQGLRTYASVACGGQAAPPLRAAAAFLAAGAAHENTGFRPLLIFGLNARACFPQFTQRACTARGALGDRRSGRTLESYVHHGVRLKS